MRAWWDVSNTPPLQVSKSPMLLLSHVLVWVQPNYMIVPSNQAYSSNVQAFMQGTKHVHAIQGLMPSLEIPMLLLQSKSSSKQAINPPCAHYEESHQAP